MDSSKLILLVHTAKHLRYKQIFYRLYYLIRNRFFKKEYTKSLNRELDTLIWKDYFLYTDSYKKENTFVFLNRSHDFGNTINWNYGEYGKLWTYNLNYFDFLNQEHISSEEGLALILDYIEKDAILKDGKEPYPISLRGINWVKFLSRNSISNLRINEVLSGHYETLYNNVEYHLMGNHVLENGFSLFFGAYYLKDERLYTKAWHILKNELTEQTLNDGAHFERSPMYHQIMLHRLLDCINLAQLNPWKDEALPFLKEKALKMLSWLQEVTFSNGTIPMVNDSAYGIAPNSRQLFDYAESIGLQWPKGQLSDCGYRMYSQDNYELFVDVGKVGPDYQPGHAHSDTFSFELYVGGNPVIVDTGTSTYEKNALRQQERETAAHNTVKIGNHEQTQVWGGFRVAQRAKITHLKESENQIEATHDGYKKLGVHHTRKFLTNASGIEISDSLNKEAGEEQFAFFHFHPSIKNIELGQSQVKLTDLGINIIFGEGVSNIEIQTYNYALGFNKTEKSQKITVSFQKSLRTQIVLPNSPNN